MRLSLLLPPLPRSVSSSRLGSTSLWRWHVDSPVNGPPSFREENTKHKMESKTSY
jgi:hypothetical protein